MRDHSIRARHVGALIALSMAAFAYVTTETLPIGLLSLIARGTHSSLSAVGLLVTYYGLVVVVVTIPLTHLTRQVPRRYLISGLLAVFALATLGSALASSYGLLLASRIVTALSQAVFWATVVASAAGMFPQKVRGRAVSLVFAGNSLAALVGVPMGTWVGQNFGWRSAFGALSCVALLTMLAVAWLLPTTKPGEGEASRGTAPDARRYWLTIVVVSLAGTGAFASFTYITPFLAQVSRFSLGSLSLILLIRGIAGLGGVVMGGRMSDWNPWIAIGTPVAMQAVALCTLYLTGSQPVATVILVSLAGLSFSAMCTALTGRVLRVAPGSVDMATAGTSIAVNIGITAGALIGGLLLSQFGVRSTALAGGLLSIAALAAVSGEFRLRSHPASPEPEPALLTTQHT
jgi:MFS transporter, DHA1 family, inner membrane transport protein